MKKTTKMNENDIQNESTLQIEPIVQFFDEISKTSDNYDCENQEFLTRNCNYVIYPQDEMLSNMKIIELKIRDINSMNYEEFQNFSSPNRTQLYFYEDDIRWMCDDCCRELDGHLYADEAASLFELFWDEIEICRLSIEKIEDAGDEFNEKYETVIVKGCIVESIRRGLYVAEYATILGQYIISLIAAAKLYNSKKLFWKMSKLFSSLCKKMEQINEKININCYEDDNSINGVNDCFLLYDSKQDASLKKAC